MKGITATAAACCLAATSVSASLPAASGTLFGVATTRSHHAFAGLDSRGGAVGKSNDFMDQMY